VAATAFFAVGDVLVDVVSEHAPSAGERLHAPVVLRAGGSAVNAALWAAGRGAAATVVGRVGADAAGDLVERSLAEGGVASALARDRELPTGIAVALGIGEAGAVVVEPGASRALMPEDVPLPLEADALLVSGFTLFQAGAEAGARRALEASSGRWAAVDFATPWFAAAAADRLDELTEGANVLLATAEEARAATGLEPEEAARALAARYEVVAVKLGAEGALAVAGEEVERQGATRIERRTPFGAGDAFAAAFLLGLARGDSLGPALESACAAGAAAASGGVV
jgi:sugar/nucleoside kinase (ribokinase family)